MVPVITVDGPSGSGKGTVCKSLSKLLNWNLLDSGLIYRVLAFELINKKINFDEKDSALFVAKNLNVEFKTYESRETASVLLNNHDITDALRSEEVALSASSIAGVAEIRSALFDKQRDFAEPPGLIADGRDMGTVVFSDAPLKIFLTASAEIRAKRRQKQLMSLGQSGNLADLVNAITARDELDTNRSVSPLLPAFDAVTIDSSNLSIDQVRELILDLAKQRELIS